MTASHTNKVHAIATGPAVTQKRADHSRRRVRGMSSDVVPYGENSAKASIMSIVVSGVRITGIGYSAPAAT